jgi:hypothetical protein
VSLEDDVLLQKLTQDGMVQILRIEVSNKFFPGYTTRKLDVTANLSHIHLDHLICALVPMATTGCCGGFADRKLVRRILLNTRQYLNPRIPDPVFGDTVKDAATCFLMTIQWAHLTDMFPYKIELSAERLAILKNLSEHS